MVKLIVGLKGSGKTKSLIQLANTAVDTSNGTVVCLEKGTKLMHEIQYQARLVNTDEYGVSDGEMLFGFVAGIIASDHDAKDIFIDHALKICQTDLKQFEEFVLKTVKLAEQHDVRVMMTRTSCCSENRQAGRTARCAGHHDRFCRKRSTAGNHFRFRLSRFRIRVFPNTFYT